MGDQDQKEEDERKKALEKEKQGKKNKEDQKEDRKGKYEDKGENAKKPEDIKREEDAKRLEEIKRAEQQVSSPPSYQPKEGTPVYHNQPHIEKYINPAAAAMKGMQSSYAGINKDYAPAQHLPQIAKYAAAGIQQNFSPEIYAQNPNKNDEYEESEENYYNQPGINFQNMPQRINMQNN